VAKKLEKVWEGSRGWVLKKRFDCAKGRTFLTGSTWGVSRQGLHLGDSRGVGAQHCEGTCVVQKPPLYEYRVVAEGE